MSEVNFRLIIDEIKINFTDEITNYEEIKAGFSSDKKYRLFSKAKTYLLRLSKIEQAGNRKTEFEIMQKAINLGVRCNIPIKFDTLAEHGVCYSIFSYLDGVDAAFGLKSVNDQVAFSIGVEAGKDLKLLHKILPPTPVKSWKERAINKHHRYLKEYESCGYSFSGDRDVLDYIEKGFNQLEEVESIFQHDDFHAGNIIMKDGKYVGVIDFNRMDWGDYVQDFVKMGWFSRSVNKSFAVGQLKGYFTDGIPEEFWNRYSLYMAVSIISTIAWHKKFFPHLMNEIIPIIHMVLDDHENFNFLKPNWFVKEG